MQDEDRVEQAVAAAVRGLLDFWPIGATILGAGLLALSSWSLPDPAWPLRRMVILGGGITLSGVGAWVGCLRAPRIAKLQRQKRKLEDQVSLYTANSSSIFHEFLANLLNYRLALGDTERVSVYIHDGQEFRILGRYSKNPSFNVCGRMSYPDSAGCIGHAWHKGETFVPGLPDPASDYEGYVEQSGEYGLSSADIESLTMRSREYWATALEDVTGRSRVGVIVFESTQVGNLNPYLLRVTLGSDCGRQIADFLGRLPSIGDRYRMAEREGI